MSFKSLISACACLALLSGCSVFSSLSVSVTNQSSQSVADVFVTLGDQSEVVKDLPVGNSRKLALTLRGDAGYHVRVKYADGKVRETDGGYVTPGATFHDVIIILDDRVALVQLSSD